MANETNFEDIQFIIENRAKQQWAGTEVAYQDVPYVVKKDIDYIALNTLFGESENSGLSSMNNPQHPIRENGVLLIQCYSKSDNGTKRVLEIAGLARALYQNTEENGLVFYAGSLSRAGENTDFIQYDVNIPFYYQNNS